MAGPVDAARRSVAVATKVELTLLGEFRARVAPAAGSPADVRIPGRKVRALLAFLALSPDRAHERDSLAALLWGDTSDAEARHSLRQALSVLRRALPGALRPGDRVEVTTPAVHVDAAEFERLAAGRDTASLDAAARLYRGDLLDGFHVQSEPFAEWLRAERERLRELAIDALARLLGAHERAGAVADGIRVGLRLLELDPLQEPVHRAIRSWPSKPPGTTAAPRRRSRAAAPCPTASVRSLRAAWGGSRHRPAGWPTSPRCSGVSSSSR